MGYIDWECMGVSKGLRDRFEQIYTTDGWLVRDTYNRFSRSGSGSLSTTTQEIVRVLPIIVNTLRAGNLLDLPCGHYGFMNAALLGDCQYVGADVVKSVVEENERLYPNVSFKCLDATVDRLPQVDVIFCKDMFQHLTNSEIGHCLERFRASARYLITSSDCYPSPRDNRGRDIKEPDYYAPENLCASPFQLHPPLLTIRCDMKFYSVWNLRSGVDSVRGELIRRLWRVAPPVPPTDIREIVVRQNYERIEAEGDVFAVPLRAFIEPGRPSVRLTELMQILLTLVEREETVGAVMDRALVRLGAGEDSALFQFSEGESAGAAPVRSRHAAIGSWLADVGEGASLDRASWLLSTFYTLFVALDLLRPTGLDAAGRVLVQFIGLGGLDRLRNLPASMADLAYLRDEVVREGGAPWLMVRSRCEALAGITVGRISLSRPQSWVPDLDLSRYVLRVSS